MVKADDEDYTPSLSDLDLDGEEDYIPSIADLGFSNVGDLNQAEPAIANKPQPTNNGNFFDTISNYLPGRSMSLPINLASGLASLTGNNGGEARLISDLPQSLTGTKPTALENVEHSIGRNIPSLFFPEFQGGYIPSAISRIAGQGLWGASTSEDKKEGGLTSGIGQAVLEGAGAIPRTVGKVAEFINPQKYAGRIAEAIRTNARTGYEKAQKYYNPVHEKYDENLLTPTPKKYLGFKKEDLQYFKPIVRKSYNDFIAEPNFKNLHQLQHEMGQQPELRTYRTSIKDKIQSYLSHDKPMQESYNTGSNIMKEEYYPYRDTNVLADITEHQKPIESFDPKLLSKEISKSRVYDKSNKSLNPIDHPLVDLGNKLQNKMHIANALKYGLPLGIGMAAGQSLGNPFLGLMGGMGAGGAFAHFAEPKLLELAQNKAIINALKNYFEPTAQGVGRQIIGYNNSNQ